MDFSDVPIRAPGTVDPSWWNSLRTAGLRLQSMLGLGTGAIGETAFTFANTQGAAADVTALLFSSAVCKSAYVWICARRKTDSASAYSEVELWLSYDAANSTWLLQDEVEHGGPSGLTFTVTSAGQVKYTSDTVSGSNYSGASKFKALTTV